MVVIAILLFVVMFYMLIKISSFFKDGIDISDLFEDDKMLSSSLDYKEKKELIRYLIVFFILVLIFIYIMQSVFFIK